MREDMNLSVNGQSQVPPGFRFHPTEEELLRYYLRKKVAYEKIDLDVIRDVDLNKLEPWDIQEKCKIGSTPQNDWYFFSHKDKKYPTGTRTNRATAAGFWKATGRDKVIYSNSRRIGMRKTLVFYRGRAPHGQKSDWIMHEYRLDDNSNDDINATTNPLGGESVTEEGWVVCRVFKKKNYHKALDIGHGPQGSSTSLNLSSTQTPSLSNDHVLDQILVYMGRSCKQESKEGTFGNGSNTVDADNAAINMQLLSAISDRFVHLPSLESSPSSSTAVLPSLDNINTTSPFTQSMEDLLAETEPSCIHQDQVAGCNHNSNNNNGRVEDEQNIDIDDGVNHWAAFDRLVASQLNGQLDISRKLSCYAGHMTTDDFCFSIDHDLQLPHLRSSSRPYQATQVCGSDVDLWTFARSASSSPSDPLAHLSV